MKAISTDKAPPAIGPYVQAIVSGGMAYCSGCLAMNEKGDFLGGTATEQATKALENLSHVLLAAGSNMQLVTKTTVFLTDMADFAAVNEVYTKAFGAHRPARSCVAVAALPRNASVEIEAIAEVKS